MVSPSTTSTETATLASIPVGDQVLVVSASTTPHLLRRLAELGIRRGVPVTVVQRTSGGGRVVDIGSARYAIDNQTLKSITVKHV